jgi:D-xylonolactonase
LVVCGATGLHLWKEQDQFVTLASQHESEPLVFNDMIADPDGGVYAGTLYWDERGMTKHGKLFHISPAGKIQVVEDGTELANGLGFSADGRTLYFADSAARAISAYDVDRCDGSLRNKRIFVRVGEDEGIPDGLTVDSEGFVYSAQWYGGQVVRYDPDGKAQQRIKLPVTQVSSVAFGGTDLCDLYVTTAADPWPSALRPSGFDPSAPTGGGLFRIRVQTPGVKEHIARLRTKEPGN